MTFFSLDFEQVLYEKEKCSRKKIMWWSSCSETTQKTNLLQLFCNVVGCKTQISIVLGCSLGRFT